MKAIHQKNIIQNNVKKYREKRGMTRDELAEYIGITANNIGQIENGKQGMRMSTLIAISKALEIRLDKLIHESEL